MSGLAPFERKRQTVAVLMGGTSVERPVSLKSGKEVANALEAAGYAVTRIDVGADIAALVKALTPKPDAVFNALHGKGGEDGAMQGLLDLMEIPYTHSGRMASALAMDKPAAKRVFASAGLRCAEGKLVSREELLKGDPLPRPYVVKPPAEGSSFGVSIVKPGDNELPFTAADWPYGEEVLVESFIPGRELTVAVIGEGASAKALGAIEIRPVGGFFDYHSKYTKGQAEHLLPPPIHQKALAELMEIGLKAHVALGCRGASRADVRYDDTKGEPGGLYLLEVNTQPGMTPMSLVPEIAASQGINFTQLVSWMVEEARFGMTRAVVPIVERSRAVVPQRRKSRRKSPWKRFRKPALRVGAVLLVAGIVGGGVFVTKSSGGPAVMLAPVGQAALSLTGMIGLRVSDLQVDGRHMADRQAVTDAIHIQRDMPILGYDLEAARARLEALPWIETAMVERRLPDTIFVSLTERHPLALWQRNGKFSVIDAKGVEITTDQVGAYSSLPVVVGPDAPPAAENLLLMLDGEPEMKHRVTAAVRVGGRRWNLRLDNRVDVKLPEQDPAVAWSALAQLERDQKLLEREIVAIDFRQSDRMIVQLTPEAAALLHVDKQVIAATDKTRDEKEPSEAPAATKPNAAKPAAKPQAGPLQAAKPQVNKPGSTPTTGKQ